MATSRAAISAKDLRWIRLTALAPRAKKIGLVPRVKANIIPAPVRGSPEVIAKTIIACVTPQGINTVINPKRPGVKRDSFFVILRAARCAHLGGWSAV